MRKIRFALFMLIALGLVSMLAGCSSESKGVPDGTVYMEFGEEFEDLKEVTDSASYKIEHNVDHKTHMDNVTVEFVAKSEFLEGTFTKEYLYQYDKSSDLWTLIDESYEWEETLELNEQAVLGEWVGRFGDIIIHEINETSILVSCDDYDGNWYAYETYELYPVGGQYPKDAHFSFKPKAAITTICWDCVKNVDERCVKVG